MALWTPAEIPGAIVLDALDSTHITLNGSTVSAWADMLGSGITASQATASAQPTMGTGEITFDGGDKLAFSGSASAAWAKALYSTGGTVFAIARFGSVADPNAPYVLLASNGWAANTVGFSLAFDDRASVPRNNAAVSFVTKGSEPVSVNQVDLSTVTPNQKNLLNWRLDPDNATASARCRFAVNAGTELATNTLTGGITTSNSTYDLTIGSANIAVGALVGSVVCLVIVPSIVSDDDLAKIQGWAAWRHSLDALLPPGHPYKSSAPADPDALEKFLSQPYSLWPDPYQIASDQLYSIADPIDEVALEQLYSMMLEIWLTQHYGDVPLIGTSLVQPYGVAPVLTRWLEQRWDHAPELEASLDQPWSLPDLLQAVSVQSYGIAAEVLTAVCDQLYHINANTTLFATLIQPYTIAAETARLYQFDTRLYIDGERIPYHALEWQATETEFVWSCEFSVKDLAVAAKCVDGAAITIVSAGDTWQLKCYGGWLLDKRHADTVYRISGYSQPWDLSQAPPLLGDIDGGMASAIVAGLASPHGIAIDWQMVDGYIASGLITANDQAPSELIKDIVHDGGGIVLSTIAGGLLVVAEEEVPVPDWPTTTPAQTIEAVLERISTSEQRDEQKGYNSFDVSDQLASGDSYRLEENLIDSRTKEFRLFLVPIAADQQYVLTHSSDSGVSVEPFGIVSLKINDELVEFVAGSGRTSKPMYGLSGSAWQKENLGAVTWSEDGVLTAATPGYSLLKVSYVTMFRKWIARDPRIEDVQFRAEKVTA